MREVSLLKIGSIHLPIKSDRNEMNTAKNFKSFKIWGYPSY